MEDQALSVRARAGDKAVPERRQTQQAPTPAAGPSAVATRPHLVLPALASAGLLWLCYFPVAWGWLGWVALVPLLALVRADASPRRIKLCAWLAGSVFFWPILSWMRLADYRMYYTWAMLAIYCSLYFPVAIALLRRLDRNTALPLIVTVPAVWVGLEFIRSFLLTGFAWYYLGHTQHDYLAVIQVSDLGGVYLVSVLVAAVNAWLFEVLYAWPSVRRFLGLPGGGKLAVPTPPRRLAVQGAAVAALVVAALIYGACRLSEDAFTPGPRLALLQGSIDQRLRNVDLTARDANAQRAAAAIYQHYGDLDGMARGLPMRIDLVVWPETSFPDTWFEIAPHVPLGTVSEANRELALRQKEWLGCYARGKDPRDPERRTPLILADGKTTLPPANVLLGLNAEVIEDDSGRPRKYNSALLWYENGARGERYDKIHRVPFGEYVPFRDWFPWMDSFAPYENDYSIRAGQRKTRFTLDRFRFGVLICFEDTDPFLARPYGRQTADGPAVDFLVNISNDGWFDGSSEHDEHLAISRFRAIEARRSVARAANMGISAIIDGNGRVLKPEVMHERDAVKRDRAPLLWVRSEGAPVEDLPVSEWADYKKVWGVLVADVPIDHRTSLYSRWGDWLPGVCWAVVGAGLVWAWFRRRRQRSARPRAA